MKKRQAHNRIEVDIVKLKDLYSQGYPVTQISKIMNTSVDALRYRIKELNLPKPIKRKPRIVDNTIKLDDKKIIDLYCKDLLTIEEIRKRFNVNYGTIKLRLKQNNIELRTVSESKILMYKNRPEIKKKISISGKGRTGKLSSRWKGGYSSRNLPLYETYMPQIAYAEECRENPNNKKILQVKCTYCNKWFTPSIIQVYERIRCLNGTQMGEGRFYCSNPCKEECPIFGKISYPKGFKSATSREIQPELRQLRFGIDNFTCQRCGKNQSELNVGLHCHHIEGIRWDPLESADIDKVITLCKDCHIKVHQKEGCQYIDMRCGK